jgi:hypothetical protein
MGMFPLQALLAHAELTKSKSSNETAEARRAPRRQRCGNLTLYPVVVRAEPVFATEVPVEVRVVASISNISSTGLGLIAAEALPEGLEFDVQWDQCGDRCGGQRPLRFEVVHSRPAVAGMYRVGARLIAGELPEEPTPEVFTGTGQADADLNRGFVEDVIVRSDEDFEQPSEGPWSDEPYPIRGGIMKFAPEPRDDSPADGSPAPRGTFKASSAFGFDKIEKLDGRTTCGWERSIEMRREGDKMWVYIHSPGKKNGWGVYVDANQFESAIGRIQSASKSPFVTSMAA